VSEWPWDEGEKAVDEAITYEELSECVDGGYVKEDLSVSSYELST
jgi:hypothetical protein